MTGAAPAVQLADVRVRYGDLEVVHGVDLSVQQGEFHAVLGANGAGKTTLLATIAGILTPSGGSVAVLGRAGRESPNRRAKRGVLFIGDDRQLFPSLSVEQTLRLVRRREADATEIFPELRPLVARKVALLSGGEQQMLALGRALSAGPRVIVVDELSQGLAPLIRDRLLAKLRAVADDGTTVIVVEQAVEAVLSVADRASVLSRGELVETRSAADWRADIDRLASTYVS